MILNGQVIIGNILFWKMTLRSFPEKSQKTVGKRVDEKLSQSHILNIFPGYLKDPTASPKPTPLHPPEASSKGRLWNQWLLRKQRLRSQVGEYYTNLLISLSWPCTDSRNEPSWKGTKLLAKGSEECHCHNKIKPTYNCHLLYSYGNWTAACV